MLIQRFHKLIQSKLVWILFIGIIVISFVALQVASDSARDPVAARLEMPVARIDGKEVSFLKLDVTRRLIGLQNQQRMDPDLLHDVALNHLAMVAYAQSMGIEVDREFAARQFALNFTNENGELDEAALNRFRQSIRGTQISESDYIAFIQEQLIVDQLRRAMAGAVLVPDFDAERWAEIQTDEFVVEYAPMGPDLLSGTVEATPEQTAAFFAENQERFRLPEERIVRYVTLSSASLADEITAPTLDEAQARYNASPESYVREVEVPAEAEGEEPTTKREPIPFDEVQERIQEEMTTERLTEAARSRATNLAIRMTPRRGRPAESFEAVVEEAGLEILTTPAFSRRSPLEGPASSPAFQQQAFDLDQTEFGERGGPVQVGSDFILMELVEVIPPRIPELSEVQERVQAAASRQEQMNALETRVEEVAEEIRNAVADGQSFAEAAKEKGLNPLTSDPISLMALDPRRSMFPMELVQELPAHKQGEIIGPVPTRFGGFFLASVLERTSQPVAKEESLEQTQQMLASQLHFQGMFSRFQEQIIQPMIEEL